MPDYTFNFDPAASGLPYVVKDRGGLTVATGTLDSSDDAVKITVTLPWGAYVGKASAASLPYTSPPAFFATGDIAAETPGASETAYFTGTGPALVSDGNDYVSLTLEADDREGALPDWASISAGSVELEPEAGTCAFSAVVEYTYDFTTAEGVSDDPGALDGAFRIAVDGNNNNGAATQAGDGENVQVLTSDQLGGLLVGSTVSFRVLPTATDDQSAAITDADVTVRATLSITRLAPAPTLP